MKIKITIATLILLLSSAVISSAQSATSDESYNFNVEPHSAFRFKSLLGSVKITGWEKQIIEINLRKTATGEDSDQKLDKLNLKIRQYGNRVECLADFGPFHRKGSKNKKRPDIWLAWEIKVPHDCKIESFDLIVGSLDISDLSDGMDLNLSKGSIEAENISGDIRMNIAYGSISAVSIHGTTEITVAAGNVDLEEMTGSLEARMTSGRLSVEAIDLEWASLTTTNGDIELEVQSPLTYGTFKMKSLTGNIELHIPSSSAFNLSAESSTGDNDVNFPGLTSSKQLLDNKVFGEVNGGGADIRISTFEGDIEISH